MFQRSEREEGPKEVKDVSSFAAASVPVSLSSNSNDDESEVEAPRGGGSRPLGDTSECTARVSSEGTWFYYPSFNVSCSKEYVAAKVRWCLKTLQETSIRMLEGHDTADLFLSWAPSGAAASGADRGPAQAAAHTILQYHKKKKKRLS